MGKDKKIIIGICLSFAVLLIIVLNLFVQMNVAGTYPLDETVGSAVKSLILRGGILSCILVAGITMYFLIVIQQLTKKQNQIEEITAKLIKKDFSSTEIVTDDTHLRELQKNFNLLCVWINQLKDHALSLEQLEKSFAAKSREQDDELESLRGQNQYLTQKISAMEKDVSIASDELNITNNTIKLYQKKISEQNELMREAEQSIADSNLLIQNLTQKVNESSVFSAELAKEIISGEDQVTEVSDMIKGISDDLEKIQEITKAINKISEQTNILSMNAAIESAHAGPAGAGFGVVADEIRKLAESTRENAGQISKEVNALMERMKLALQAGKDSSISFNGMSKRIHSFSENIIPSDSLVSQSLEKTAHVQNAIKNFSEASLLVHESMRNTQTNFQRVHVDNYSTKKDDEAKTPNTTTREIDSSILRSSFKPDSPVSAENHKTNNEEKSVTDENSKRKIYTLKQSSSNEKIQIEKMRDIIETVEIPNSQSASNQFEHSGTSKNEEDDYDERGVAVKQPPITIY